MWRCLTCREDIEDQFQVCWSCGTAADGTLDPTFRSRVEMAAAATAKPLLESIQSEPHPPAMCGRCDVALRHAGKKRFDIGVRDSNAWNILLELFIGESGLLAGHDSLNAYVCPRCGHVEFFVHSATEEFAAG